MGEECADALDAQLASRGRSPASKEAYFLDGGTCAGCHKMVYCYGKSYPGAPPRTSIHEPCGYASRPSGLTNPFCREATMAHDRRTKNHKSLVKSGRRLIYATTPSENTFDSGASAQPKLLNERQLRDEYALSIPWQRKVRREGGGPLFLKIGRLVRYRRTDVDEFLDRHAVRVPKGRSR